MIHLPFDKQGAVLVAILVSGFLFSGCGLTKVNKYETVRFDEAFEMEIPARAKPAKISSKSESELIQNNYLKIGDLSIEYPQEVCLSDSGCEAVSHSEDPTTRLLKDAAQHGADLVVLSKNNASTKGTVEVQGECSGRGAETIVG